MAFNPDAYLADTAPAAPSEFNPDAYLADQSQPYQGTALENTAQALTSIGQKVAPYAQQVMSQPDVQPFQGLNPFSKPQGGAVGQVLGSMRQVASLPLRYSAALGQASKPVSEFWAEQGVKPGSVVNRINASVIGGPIFGQTQTAQNAAANPYVAGAAGIAAGVAADPRSWVPVGGASMKSSDELPLKAAQAREARTGVPARQFQALYKDPGAFFAGGKVEQAGADIGAAKAAAGINPGVTNDIASLTPENIDRINPTKAVKIEDVNTVLGKITSGQTPTAQEAQNALDSVNSIMSQPSVQNNRDVFRQWSAIKTHINEALGEAAPEVRAANQSYARQKLGQAFTTANAVNKSGTPSKLAMLAQQIPGAVGGAVGGALFGPAGAAGGYEAGKIASSLYHAPFVAGLQTAAAGAANRVINPVLDTLLRGGTSPAAQALMLRYLQQRGNQ